MKKGFTLLELMVVIIIIGILATLGLGQYARLVERQRGSESRIILGTIRSHAAAYYLEWNNASGFEATDAGVGTATDQTPSACRNSHYFSYALTANDIIVTATGTRCGPTGRGGDSGATGRTIILTTTYPAGTDSWSGNGGY